ncbi:uncharacterized protein LY89DRAFT_735965 [Mollisia scopiformis]|uniref:Uncharacterized protein n=1 Tax=Mollisia scopiformis TaxID=149040 RepID=A0A194X3Z0_MOLSC|nr:uncharacterized protein LY89DRAFT_735965 [Mollisia scopiformis]KUJ14905.1 hypothetical protein LY89DRAFT_735965 [Mollisia scopiformis]
MSTSSASIVGSDISASTTPTSPTTTISSEDQHPHEAPPWILHHVLHPECAAELPLTTMFSFNSGQKPSSLRDAQAWWQLDPEGRLLTQVMSSFTDSGPWTEEKQQSAQTELEPVPLNVTQPIGHALDHHMNPEHEPRLRKVRFVDPPPPPVEDRYLKKPHAEPAGLPYEYIKDFCLKAFPAEYEQADFSNPLKALDYLRDLEFTRRAQLRAAGRRWGITEYTWQDGLKQNPITLAWYLRMQHVEMELQKWFAQMYVGLRIWIMINELKQPWLSRQEILAMLNTLYPPVILSVPSDQISIKQLHWHRKVIFGWILAVEKDGPEAILGIEDSLLKGKHSWRKITLSLENYLKHAKNQIDFALTLGHECDTLPGEPNFHRILPANLPHIPRLDVLDENGKNPEDSIMKARWEKVYEKSKKSDQQPVQSVFDEGWRSRKIVKFFFRYNGSRDILTSTMPESSSPTNPEGSSPVSQSNVKPASPERPKSQPTSKLNDDAESDTNVDYSTIIPPWERPFFSNVQPSLKPLGFKPPILPENPEEDISALIPRPLFFPNAKPLASDNMAFLKSDPFAPPPPPPPPLVVRRHSSLSNLTLRDSKFLPKTEGEEESEGPKLRKKRSFIQKMTGAGKDKEKIADPVEPSQDLKRKPGSPLANEFKPEPEDVAELKPKRSLRDLVGWKATKREEKEKVASPLAAEFKVQEWDKETGVAVLKHKRSLRALVGRNGRGREVEVEVEDEEEEEEMILGGDRDEEKSYFLEDEPSPRGRRGFVGGLLLRRGSEVGDAGAGKNKLRKKKSL